MGKKHGALAGASKAAAREAAARPERIAEKGGKSKARERQAQQAESDSDNDELEDSEDDDASMSSSTSSVIVRKQNTSDKHTLMSAQQQEEQLLPKTVQPSIDKQIKVTAEKGRDLAAHCTRYPFADHHATDSEHHVIEHLYSPEFPFIYASICIH
jgi:hypothetical protein